MSYKTQNFFEVLFGILFWLVIGAVSINSFGAYRVFVIAALLVALIGSLAVILPRIQQWKKNRVPCPHGIRGGIQLQMCPACSQKKKQAEEEQQKKIEAAAQIKKISIDAMDTEIIEAERLINLIVPKISELREMTPQQFEDEIAHMFKRLGYSVKQTPYTNDGGWDATLTKNEETFLLECKRYGENNAVGRPELQKFHSAVVSNQAKSGFFVTTGPFSAQAKEYGKKIGFTLIDSDELLRYMVESKPMNSKNDRYCSMCRNCGEFVWHHLRSPKEEACSCGHVVQPTLSIESLLGKSQASVIPLCPHCKQPMKLINGKHGKFWGCSQYPKCHSTAPYKKTHPFKAI